MTDGRMERMWAALAAAPVESPGQEEKNEDDIFMARLLDELHQIREVPEEIVENNKESFIQRMKSWVRKSK
jgi:uncharacterized ferredoxin-like protein